MSSAQKDVTDKAANLRKQFESVELPVQLDFLLAEVKMSCPALYKIVSFSAANEIRNFTGRSS